MLTSNKMFRANTGMLTRFEVSPVNSSHPQICTLCTQFQRALPLVSNFGWQSIETNSFDSTRSTATAHNSTEIHHLFNCQWTMRWLIIRVPCACPSKWPTGNYDVNDDVTRNGSIVEACVS